MSTLQDLSSDSEAESSVAFSEASSHTEVASMNGASAISGIFMGSFHFKMSILLDYFAYDRLCLQDTPVMGDLQCVQALWMLSSTSDGKKGGN